MGSWFGSKATSGLCQPIIALMPPHDTYIETHLGGGAIMQRKPAARHSIGIDRDARALERFACDYPVEKIHGCAHPFLATYPFTGRELVYSDPHYRVLPVSLREFQRPVRYGVSPAYWVKPRPRADAAGDGQPGKNGG